MNIKDKIIKEFKNGFEIDKRVFDFANDTGFEISFDELKNVIEDINHEINDEICMLVFSPDFETRMRFVDIWNDLCVNGHGIDIISLAEKIEYADISYKGITKRTKPDKKYILNFFEKLNFNVYPDLNLINFIKDSFGSDFDYILAFIWENSNVLTKEKSGLVLKYFENTDILFPFVRPEFEFFINILIPWNSSKSDFHTYMARLVHIYQKAYRESVETGNFLKTNNIETFMVQGGRVPVSNPESLKLKKKYLMDIASKLHLPKDIFVFEGFDMDFPTL